RPRRRAPRRGDRAGPLPTGAGRARRVAGPGGRVGRGRRCAGRRRDELRGDVGGGGRGAGRGADRRPG
ncbi:PE family protein, partial [Mycobacterium sp. PS03-16]